MLKIGTTTLPLAGWLVDPAKPEESQARRLAAIREIVADYGLSAVELTLDLGAFFPQVFGLEFYTAVAELQQEIEEKERALYSATVLEQVRNPNIWGVWKRQMPRLSSPAGAATRWSSISGSRAVRSGRRCS